uniref:Histamine H3 receptor-like n=1 Tax=Geotrypetes seraphini TaxID=260995 RepID=A0A6P8QQ01_GEOSA|nr:histamine H3 receptor-like [Geotrypetes seraphini]
MLSLITVLGNTLVILAFVVDKNLRNHSCYFLLNLAVCDILVGALFINVFIPYTLTGRWTAGTVACKFWLIMDSTLCVSSVYSIVLISHDRFLSVTKAVAYKVLQRTNNATRNALPKIGAAWGIAFLYSFIPVILWDSGTSNVPEQCVYDFLNAWEIMISCLVLFFYLPFISVIYFNLSIYWNIRKRRHKKHMLNLPRKKDQATVFFIKERNLSEEDPLSPSYYVAEEQKPFSMEQTQNQTSLTGKPKESIRQQSNTKNQNASHLSKLEKDKQIAKSLAIIVGVYFICWGPYGLLFLISAISQCICVDHSWDPLTTEHWDLGLAPMCEVQIQCGSI